MAFLKTILVILLVYYLFKMVVRLLAPQLLNYAAKKTEERFRENFGGFSNQNPATEEKVGDVIIEKKNPNRKASSKNVGEYIEFEEID